MTAINAALTRLFDLFFAPLRWAEPWGGLVALAVLTAVVALLVFRYTSNQRRIRELKDRIISHLLEVVLYRDEIRVVLRAERSVLWDNLRYFMHAMVPLACMILPMAAILLQADLRYGNRPLRAGEQAIVAVKLDGGGRQAPPTVSAPPGLEIETPPLRIPVLNEVDWRIRAVKGGEWELRFAQGGEEFTKRVVVGSRRGIVPEVRVRQGVWQQFAHPGEPPLPATTSASMVRVSYPNAEIRLGGWRMHWVWPYLVLTLVIGYALKGPLKVQV